jgi:hypothetical protein
MTGKTRYIGFAFLAALLALSSCRDLALEPVFYALSQEIPLGDDKGFPDVASVFRMLKYNDGAADRYLAAAGRLYTRGVGTTDTWTVVAPPAGLADAMCNTLEIFNDGGGDDIYAGFYNSSNGDGYGLWTSALSSSPVWTEVTDAAVQNKGIALLKRVGSDLFISTHLKTSTTSTYALYYWNGALFTLVDWAVDPPAEVGFLDVARATSGGSYWILVGDSLYQSGTIGGAFAVYGAGAGSPPVSPLSGPPASGGLFDDGNALYLSAGNGHLYRTPDGGANWTRTVSSVPDNDGDPVRFTTFAAPGADAIPAGNVYVGTQGQGYFRVEGGAVDGTLGTQLIRQPAYNITALYSGSLNFLFYDAANLRLFLGTNGSGLWRGDYASGSVWTWKQE